MSKYFCFFFFGLLSGCTTTEETGQVVAPPHVAPASQLIRVKWVDVDVLARYPVVVNVVTELAFADDCVAIAAVSEKRQDNQFIIQFHERRIQPPCKKIPNEYIIPLETNNLESGLYSVEVNGVKTEFELIATERKRIKK